MTTPLSQQLIDRANSHLGQRAPSLSSDLARRRAEVEAHLGDIDREAAATAERVGIAESHLADLVNLQHLVLSLERELDVAKATTFENLRLDDLLSDNLDPLAPLKISAAFAELQRAELTVKYAASVLKRHQSQLRQGIEAMRTELAALQLSAGPMLGILRRVRQDLAGAVDLLAAELSPQTHN